MCVTYPLLSLSSSCLCLVRPPNSSLQVAGNIMTTVLQAKAWGSVPCSWPSLRIRYQVTCSIFRLLLWEMVHLLAPFYRWGNQGAAFSDRTMGNGGSAVRTQVACPWCPHSQPLAFQDLYFSPSQADGGKFLKVLMTRKSLIGPADVTWPSLTQSLWSRGCNVLTGQLGLWARFRGAERGDGTLWLTSLPKAQNQWMGH